LSRKNLCESCNAKCCHHLALEIDKPEGKAAFEDMRWYLAHRGVQVFVEKGKWYLQVRAACRHLGKDNRCRIYEKRPRICKAYNTSDCEGNDLEFDYEVHLKSDADLEAWLASKKSPRSARRKRP